MGRASGESFGQPCVCWQLQDGGDNSDVESKYQQKGKSDNQHTEYIDHHLIHKDVSTSPFEQWRNVTEEMIDCVGATERQSENLACLAHLYRSTADPGGNHQADADLGAMTRG